MLHTARLPHTAAVGAKCGDLAVPAAPRRCFAHSSSRRCFALPAVVDSQHTSTAPSRSACQAGAHAQPQRRVSVVADHVALHTPSRRLLLTGALLSSTAGWVQAAAAAVAAPPQKTPDKQQLDNLLDKEMAEIRAQVPEEVAALDEMMKKDDAAVDSKALEAVRLKNGFKRSKDGRVFVRSDKGKWYTVKTDMYMAGYLLLQDAGGLVWYLAPGEAGDLQQVDLSDDMVVAMLFTSGEWVPALRPLEVEGDKGKSEQLTLTEEQFRQLLSVLGEEPA